MLSFQSKKLKRNFYKRDVQIVAKELLGKLFVMNIGKQNFTGMIVETEAYDSQFDQASHSYKGMNNRNKIMFEGGGHLYIYLIYGVHHCANVVTGKKGNGAAVLIRAVEPLEGIELMAINRFGKTRISEEEKINLTSGPSKFCKAFGMNLNQNGADLTDEKIFLCNYRTFDESEILKSTRIGITKSKDLLWRFCVKNNPFVSKL